MISVLLDENKFFTGSYSLTGDISGGTLVKELPPEENQLCYKYDKVTKTITEEVPELEYYYKVTKEQETTDKDGNPTTETIVEEVKVPEDEISSLPEGTEVSNRVKLDESGSIITKKVEKEITEDEWILDENKISELENKKLELIKMNKISELSEICKSTIYHGIDLQTTVGTEHFDLTETDQINIKSLYDTVLNDPSAIVMYHSSKTMCRVFTSDEIKAVYAGAMNYVVYNTTLFNHLQSQILNMKSADRINEITYSYGSLTGKYKENFDTLMNVNN